MEKRIISGIQQMGIGVPSVHEAWKWYREQFGMDIRVFEESAVAALMLPYTGGKPQSRHAALAINLQSGGGFEIWQYTERTPQPPQFRIELGDLGIFSAKIKSKNVKKTWDLYKARNLDITSLVKDPAGNDTFFVRDPYGNFFQLVEGEGWFRNENKLTGGIYGAIIGVTDIEKSRTVYSDILGYDQVVYDREGVFEDLKTLPGGEHAFRRVLLKQSVPRKGSFSRLLGPGVIELMQVKDRAPRRIFENRFWGDLGFIHLCYDISGMDAFRQYCSEKGFPFTVDSAASHQGGVFDMGEAAGHFSYIADPDGTLIEFVETHKLPILKKLGWYLDLSKRDPEKPLPDWMLKTMRFSRVKDG